ncbi:MAG TPA: DUF5915 domain-containing protein, partial [Prolixibacteraceae bacterium]|nr:DUF5915 domain-containing protein [Prolixibacteraceae bacterium]
KKIKPNFKTLGPKFGKLMKQIAAAVNQLNQEEISLLEDQGQIEIAVGKEMIVLSKDDVEIQTEDIPGWTVATEGQMTIALDINISEQLKQEGIAREFINKIQNLRKESNFEVTDRINLRILKHDELNEAVNNFKDYICAQTLAADLQLVDVLDGSNAKPVEIDKGVDTIIEVEKL